MVALREAWIVAKGFPRPGARVVDGDGRQFLTLRTPHFTAGRRFCECLPYGYNDQGELVVKGPSLLKERAYLKVLTKANLDVNRRPKLVQQPI